MAGCFFSADQNWGRIGFAFPVGGHAREAAIIIYIRDFNGRDGRHVASDGNFLAGIEFDQAIHSHFF